MLIVVEMKHCGRCFIGIDLVCMTSAVDTVHLVVALMIAALR